MQVWGKRSSAHGGNRAPWRSSTSLCPWNKSQHLWGQVCKPVLLFPLKTNCSSGRRKGGKEEGRREGRREGGALPLVKDRETSDYQISQIATSSGSPACENTWDCGQTKTFLGMQYLFLHLCLFKQRFLRKASSEKLFVAYLWIYNLCMWDIIKCRQWKIFLNECKMIVFE